MAVQSRQRLELIPWAALELGLSGLSHVDCVFITWLEDVLSRLEVKKLPTAGGNPQQRSRVPSATNVASS